MQNRNPTVSEGRKATAWEPDTQTPHPTLHCVPGKAFLKVDMNFWSCEHALHRQIGREDGAGGEEED